MDARVLAAVRTAVAEALRKSATVEDVEIDGTDEPDDIWVMIVLPGERSSTSVFLKVADIESGLV